MSGAPLLPFDPPALLAARADAAERPEVYAAIVAASRVLLAEARARARHRIGMKAVFEALRWRRDFARADGLPWMLDNGLTSGMSRLVMERESDLAGVFETRETTAPNGARR